MAESPAPELQRDIQRLLGRCMLRLQQYEHLMKAILAHHELAGPVDTLEAQRVARTDETAGKTLGTLVKALFDTYAVAESYERELLPEDKTPTDRISMAFSFRIVMEPQRLAETRAAVADLVAMRNEMVHHLIGRFDLGTDDGCTAAKSYLEASYARIDQHHLQLMAWAQRMDEARSQMAAWAQTGAFHDFIVNGIAPDGSFDWPATGIVRVLKEATTRFAEDGWACLDLARHWIEAEHPEQAPEKYGCRSWPQVLAESRQFDLEYRPDKGGRRVAWFRIRTLS